MSHDQSIEMLKTEIAKCMMCGNCQAVCPIYKEEMAEWSVARGKIRLARDLLEGKLDYSDRIEDIFSLCLTCQACAENCPCGVRPDKIILAVRALLVGEKGIPAIKKTIFSVLEHPGPFKWGMRLGSKLQGVGLKKVEDTDFVSPRLPIGLDMRRVMRPLAARPLLARVDEIRRVANPKARVIFFSGCMLNYIYPEAGLAVIKVLNANDIEVITPKDQHCCGIPVIMSGDLETARRIARYNIDVFSRYDGAAFITHCGTGIDAWVHHYPELLAQDPAYADRAKALSAKACDLSQYLADRINFRKPAAALDCKVTYHDPCHMVRGVGLRTQPRELIRQIPGVQLAEMKKPDRCCGSAGSFSLTHYGLSSKIRDKKIDDILSVAPDRVITSCGACRMQLEEGLYQAGSTLPVQYVAELLAMAYGQEERLSGDGHSYADRQLPGSAVDIKFQSIRTATGRSSSA
jgi:glycolate oxidase iron-sulfur subunit